MMAKGGPQSNPAYLIKKIAALALAVIMIGISGCTARTVDTSGTTSSASETVTTTQMSTPEVTIPTTTATPETTKATTQVTTVETTAKPTPDQILMTKYDQDLKDSRPEYKLFGAKLLNVYDQAVASANSYQNKVGSYVSKNQIINYCKTGEYLVTAGDVIKHKDGSPAIALLNCNSTVIKGFNSTIKAMEVYDPNFLKILTSNGIVAFAPVYTGAGGGMFNYIKTGLVSWNADKSSFSEGVIVPQAKSGLIAESFGINLAQRGGDYEKYKGILKEQLASDCWWNLYKKTGQKYCRLMSCSDYIISKQYYQFEVSDPKIQELLKTIRTNNLVQPFAGTWDEISKSIADRPDWQDWELK